MSLWAFGLFVSPQLVYGTSVSSWAFIVGICRALSESEGPQYKGSGREGGRAGGVAAPSYGAGEGKHIILPPPQKS